jgi:predicted AAA+ superfamily ATPase
LDRLFKALALQIGQEVSYNELAQLLQVDKATVMTYLDLLEKSFIIYRLGSFSRNLRNEIKNNRKIYFWDTGIRNVLIANLNPLELRQDKGALWENFLVTERMKFLAYQEVIANRYFWRTTQQQEIDYLEERNGSLHAFEFKWKSTGKKRTPGNFMKVYQTEVQEISKDNFRSFISKGVL